MDRVVRRCVSVGISIFAQTYIRTYTYTGHMHIHTQMQNDTNTSAALRVPPASIHGPRTRSSSSPEPPTVEAKIRTIASDNHLMRTVQLRSATVELMETCQNGNDL